MDFDSFLNLGDGFGKGDGDSSRPGSPRASAIAKREKSKATEWTEASEPPRGEDIWEDQSGEFNIPDLWEQALDSFITDVKPKKYASAGSISSASPRSSANSGGSVSSNTTAPPEVRYHGYANISQSEKDWRYLLSVTSNDPFNVHSPSRPQIRKTHSSNADGPATLHTPPKPSILSPLKDERVAAYKQFQQAAALGTGQPISQPASKVSIRGTSSFRLLGTTKTQEVQGFISPADLVLSAPTNVVSERQTRTEQAPPGTRASSRYYTQGSLLTGSPSRSRGLAGWDPEAGPRMTGLHPGGRARLGSLSLPPLQPPCPRPSAGRSNSDPSTAYLPSSSTSTSVRRSRRAISASIASLRDVNSEPDDEDNSDSDGYYPSSSPGGSPLRSSTYRLPSMSATSTRQERATPEVNPRRGKGKAKGSAALALAVVTQISKLQESLSKDPNDILDGTDSIDLDNDVLGIRPGRKRKNNPIPLPVPVPHLIKKSRGRKVPHVRELTPDSPKPRIDSVKGDMDDFNDEDEYGLVGRATSRGSRSRKVTAYSLGEGGKRAYKCDVEGCGKCFVRGEHLKRHVRSIHTYDKPHPCPYQGCEKSFSRRDNLGQHVRIHLQA